jgi:hypothetical protein
LRTTINEKSGGRDLHIIQVLIAVMEFACVKGPSIVADGFDIVIKRNYATNSSVSLGGTWV